MIHTFNSVGKIIYGNGASSQIGKEVKRIGATTALIVTGKSAIINNACRPIMESLQKYGIRAEIFCAAAGEPTSPVVEDCAVLARKSGAELIIGLGGGSVLDTAKAAALLATNDGPLQRYFGVDQVHAPCLPMILVPTTAGTGSEVTSISVVGHVASDSKKGIVSDHLFARTVVLDPELTLSVPPKVTAATGLDAFVHAMESYVNLASTPFTDCHTLQAMSMIAQNIRRVWANGSDMEAREQMLYASALAGMGFSNTQNGVIHAIAMAVPASYNLPHGLLVGALAPMGMAFNCQAAPEKYARIAEILGCASRATTLAERAQSAIAGFESLLADLGIKPGLAAHGVRCEDIRGIAERAAATRRLMDGNPAKADADELEKLIERHF
jgi:alcohol dehydrogenase class IV